VGGGGKNNLWNQTRADVTGLPAAVATTKEATVLGAAAFAFKGTGLFPSPENFIAGADLGEEVFEPSDEVSSHSERYRQYTEGIGHFRL
jgi:L-fuculokinase